MAARKKTIRLGPRAQLNPAQQIMMQTLESAQVAVVAIFCIGIVCIATYAISMGVLGLFANPETGKLGGLALSAVVGIAAVYAIATNRNVREYLGNAGTREDKLKR